MLKEVTLVPKDKCPLDVLAEIGTQTANAWIFLHKNAVEKLRTTADEIIDAVDFLKMYWSGTEKYPSTTILLEGTATWYKVSTIEADDIAFKQSVSDPEHIFFLQMEE